MKSYQKLEPGALYKVAKHSWSFLSFSSDALALKYYSRNTINGPSGQVAHVGIGTGMIMHLATLVATMDGGGRSKTHIGKFLHEGLILYFPLSILQRHLVRQKLGSYV